MSKVKHEVARDDDDEAQAEAGGGTGQQRPTDEELRTGIKRLLPKVNLQKTGVKAFIKLLSEEFGRIDLKPRSDFIKDALAEAINEMDSDDEEDDEEEEDDDSKPAAAGGGLFVKKELSPELAGFLGQGGEMARTDVVRLMWVYIKENDLQNPDNRQQIFLDEAMKGVFGVDVDMFTMFTMNKYLGAHIHPFKKVDLTPKEKPATGDKKKRRMIQAVPESPSKKKRKIQAVPESPSKKKGKPKKAGMQPPYRLSPELAEVVGKAILPRPQVVSALWVYIKSRNLQNPDDKREILCDGRLKLIMGGKDKVSMFKMNSLITEHLVEKLDRSAYVHDDNGVEDDDDEE